ncbi:MAG: histidinol dehydrogenase [Arenicella sp.]|jgi:histidinol dehydrogenase
MNVLKPSAVDFKKQLAALLHRNSESQGDQVEESVAEIVQQVRAHGDTALFALTEQYDRFKVNAQNLQIPVERLESALKSIPNEQRQSLQYAAARIRDYHQHQLQESWQYQEQDGTVLGQKVTPIKRVGLYVPGGKAAYPSSVLMNAIPAKVAGVEQLVMVSPTPGGVLNDVVLAAARIAGIDTVLRIGGAQAIAALAYGTQSVEPVDKITGPGNIYVATAKKQVFGQVGIDMIAGPSEVLVIADESVNPDWVAMDLFAQAEHDELAQSIFLTLSETMAERVQSSIERLLPEMERKHVIAESLANNGAIIVAETSEQLIEIADFIAPEHLEIFTVDAESLAQKINNAGAIFIGPFSAESMGDYCAGPNHVLPTSGTARFSSPLGVYDFQKRTSIINISEQGAQTIGRHASIIARGESLTGHARSAEYRIDT